MLFATITAVIMLAIIIIILVPFIDFCIIIDLFNQFFCCAVKNTDKHSRRE